MTDTARSAEATPLDNRLLILACLPCGPDEPHILGALLDRLPPSLDLLSLNRLSPPPTLYREPLPILKLLGVQLCPNSTAGL
jgi:hypothetical protein